MSDILHGERWRDARDAVGRVATQACALLEAGEPVELELRLWEYDEESGKHLPSISAASYETVATLLADGGDLWHGMARSAEHTDVFYTGPDGDRVRTRTMADDEGGVHVEHVRKETVASVDLQMWCPAATTSEATVSQDHLPRMRLSLGVERPVAVPVSTDALLPEFVRIKQRGSVSHVSRGFSRATIQYDLSRVWSGKTMSAAETKQRTDVGGTYELELECVNDDFIRHHPKGDQYAALSMIVKMMTMGVAITPSLQIPAHADVCVRPCEQVTRGRAT